MQNPGHYAGDCSAGWNWSAAAGADQPFARYHRSRRTGLRAADESALCRAHWHGAETSSIDASDIKTFERDGEKWVSFTIVNRETGEKHRFEKELARQTKITRINQHEKRLVVNLDVKLGNEIITAEFSLADRSKFEYQALIGRNILTGRAIVDTSLENTLH